MGAARTTESVSEKEREICDIIRPALETHLQTKLSTFAPVASLKQVVRGTMWYMKVAIGGGEFFFLKVIENLPHLGEPRFELLGLITGKIASDRLTYFESNLKMKLGQGSAPTPARSPVKTVPESKWEGLFRRYDVDDSGFLDVHEVALLLGDVLPRAGRGPPSKDWLKKQAETLVARMDFDRDGLVDLEEFMTYVKTDKTLCMGLNFMPPVSTRSYVEANTEREFANEQFYQSESSVSALPAGKWEALFKKFDLDHDGGIDIEEISLMLEEIMPAGQGRLKPTVKYIKNAARKIMVEMDANGDGKIDLDEFVAYAKRNPKTFQRPMMDQADGIY